MKMTKGQKEVLKMLKHHGPMTDQALVPLMQHLAPTHYSSSGIRTRRAELAELGKLKTKGRVKLPSGRYAVVWKAK
jgi:hypothetical protein